MIAMQNYYDLLEDILLYGEKSDDRTGTGTFSVFGRQLRFDLNNGFPLLPGKHTSFKAITAELLWFLSGSTDNEALRELNGNDRATIWEEWQENGDLGPVYGKQWRKWEALKVSRHAEKIKFGDGVGDFYYGASVRAVVIDQIANLINGLKTNPNSRRHIVSAWHVADLPDESVSPQQNVRNGKMALAPCHYSFQMYLRNGKLSCLVNQRSVDTFLGLPFNIASYALLTHIIADIIGAKVGELIMSLGDCHIYGNHLEQVDDLLSRDHSIHPLCTLKIARKIDSIDNLSMTDFSVENYQSHQSIRAPIAI